MKPLSAQPTRPARRATTAWLIGLLATASAFAAESIDWPEASYNPVPLPDDLLVPLPCNGAMAFRVIAVGPELRELPNDTQFRDLSGPLPLGANGQGAYLLGKYEVSWLQAAALRAFAQDSDCPSALDPAQVGPDQRLRALAADQRRPEASIAWYEARGLAQDYAAWMRLHRNDYPTCNALNHPSGPCLPCLADEAAVVRLPTEPEWEYAARGGQAVSAAAFRNPLPPLTAGFDRHAWTKANAGTDPWPIGSRLAGPLGLHDIFGNVSEIQYATEANERGEVFIARGGGYQSQPDQADSRYRDRFRVYDEQGRGRLSETGLRLLIGAPVQGAPPAVTQRPEPPRPASAFWIAASALLLLTLTALGRAVWLRRRGVAATTGKGVASARSTVSAAGMADQATSEGGKRRELELAARPAKAEAQLQSMPAVEAKRQADKAARRITDAAKRREREQAARLAEAEAQRRAMAAVEAKRQAEEAEQAKPKPQREAFTVFRDRLRDGGAGPAMVTLPGGRFQMGSPENEPERRDNERQHAVRVGPFALCRTEVTFDEYDAFAKATGRALPKDQGWGRGRQPVINVSWRDATAYVEWLSEQTGSPYRLPTEAEWEYAARAGTDTRWSFGDDQADLAEHAWYDENAGRMAHPVATRKPNPWGLYDMHGNLWEWVSDWYGPYPNGDEVQTAPTGPASGSSRVLRGGAFFGRAQFLRSALRGRDWPENRDRDTGFRCARAPRRQL